MEEDTGKLIHATVNGRRVSLIDFNRSGVPLVEIVTEPDIHSAEEAKLFLKKLQQIVRYLGISDADMEKGSMRLEPNISVLKVQSSKFKVQNNKEKLFYRNLPEYKIEVKNINSFNFVKKAIDYEVTRQVVLLERGETPVQETRGWDEKKSITVPQRRKEAALDYRYFPEPDIPPMRFAKDYIAKIKQQIPEIPEAKFARFLADYRLTPDQALRLTETRELADYFELSSQFAVHSSQYKEIGPKMIANWLINKQVDIQITSPEELLQQIQTTTTVVRIDENELEAVIQKVIAANQKAVKDYRSGKTGVLMFLMGMVMKELKGKGNPQMINELLRKKLA